MSKDQASAFFKALGALLNSKLTKEAYSYETLLAITQVTYKAIERPFQNIEGNIQITGIDINIFKDADRAREAYLITDIANTTIKLLKAWQKYRGMNSHSQNTIISPGFLLGDDASEEEKQSDTQTKDQICVFDTENASVCMIDSKEVYDSMNTEKTNTKKTTHALTQALNHFLTYCVAMSISDLSIIESSEGDKLFDPEVDNLIILELR